MNCVRWGSLALLASFAVAAGSTPTEAGWWFHKKHCDTCEKQCCCGGRGCEKCEKTPCCFLPPLPPRAGVAEAIPGRITTARAVAAPATPAAVPAASCSGSNADTVELNRRVTNLENGIGDLKNQMLILTEIVKNK